MKARGAATSGAERRFPPDNWIYVQEPDVRLCRLQIVPRACGVVARHDVTIVLAAFAYVLPRGRPSAAHTVLGKMSTQFRSSAERPRSAA
jgi:hypothetical protein